MKKTVDVIGIELARAAHNMDRKTAEAFVAKRLHVEKESSGKEQNKPAGIRPSGADDDMVLAKDFFEL